MARKNRHAEGLNLAFLDVMACGLGAVILIFMLIKQQIDSAPVETDKLKQDISQLEKSQEEALLNLDSIRSQLGQETTDLAAMGQRLESQESALNGQAELLKDAESALELLKQNITQIHIPPKQEDLLEIPQVNEEHYLLGLKVEGKKIAIMLDISASMTDEKLIDIIKTKSSSAQAKKNAPKWQRTKRVMQWLLARLPKDSQVVVITYSEDAAPLGGAGWMPTNNNTVAAILNSLDKVVPEGATNLQKGLNKVNSFSPENIYIITDGLPTKGESNFRSLNPFSSCSSLTGNASTISGECRIRLFRQTLNESAPRRSRVDVILLPLEGDPDAAYEYWNWTSSTSGVLISPASDWP